MMKQIPELKRRRSDSGYSSRVLAPFSESVVQVIVANNGRRGEGQGQLCIRLAIMDDQVRNCEALVAFGLRGKEREKEGDGDVEKG